MGISGNINRVLDSKTAGMAVFALTGAGKLVSDYKEAPEGNKDFILLRDGLILGGSALGVGAYEFVTRKAVKSKTVQNTLNSVKTSVSNKIKDSVIYDKALKPVHEKFNKGTRFYIDQIKTVAHDCLDNTLMVACGIFGAIGADYAIRYSHLEKNKKLRKLARTDEGRIGTLYDFENRIKNGWENSSINKNLENTVGAEMKENIFSRITDMPAMKMFNKTMVGMQGFEVLEEKSFKARMNHSRKCLINNSLIPLFFLSISSSLTKNMKGIVRLPIIFASLVGGTMYTNKTVDAIKSNKHKCNKQNNKEEIKA